MRIKFYNVKFLYLNDRKYFREYNEENDLTPDEIDARMEELKTDYFEIELSANDEFDLSGSEDVKEQILSELLADECGEYFLSFEYETIP